MRTARIKEPAGAYYHVISRVINAEYLLDRDEKERIRRLLHRVAGFSGVEVLTYAILDSHFHLLLYVPKAREVSDAEWVKRLGCLYERSVVKNRAAELRSLRQAGQGAAAEALKRRFTYRMFELSEFMKSFKQRLSQSYNVRMARKGTLWMDRFKSLLVQTPRKGGSTSALATVAAYIDLNPVRAGLVQDPAHYRFSGYGEAVGGSRSARQGLRKVLQGFGTASWAQVSRSYRKLLYVAGEAQPQRQGSGKPGFSPQKVRQVVDAGGRLPAAELLRCRVRYFTNGVVLGSEAYLADIRRRHGDRVGTRRAPGIAPLAGAGRLCTLCRPRSPVLVPA